SGPLRPLYPRSELTHGAVMMLYGWLPSRTASLTPVTVRPWGVFQFAVVNVTDAGDTVPSVVSLLEIGTVTVAVGCEVSTTVKVAVPPLSVVVRPAVGFTMKPALSLSMLVTDTLAAFLPLYRGSTLVAGAVMMVYVWLPSANE